MNHTRIINPQAPETSAIIETIDGLPIINERALTPDQKTVENLNQDFKALVDSVLGQKK